MEDPIKKQVIDLFGTVDKKVLVGEARDVVKQEIRRFEDQKYRYFTPNGKGEEFIRKVGEGKNFIILFSAANGVGKTATSANIVAHIIWGKDSENKYFDFPLFKEWPYPMRGRIVSDPTNIEKNLIPTLKEWFPAKRYKTSKAGKHFDSYWKSDNGWEFDIMSYEQDAKEFESATLGWAWFDEPPTEAIFKATVARMRKGGIIFISETPLYAAWLYDHIIANPDTELAAKGQRVYIEADVEDACKQHGIRGHLEHEHIERMIAEYTEDEKQARVHGKFQHLIGLRFKQFSRLIHVVRPFNITYNDYTVYEALDPHDRTPDTVNWIAVDRKRHKFVIDELWLKCQGGTEELAQKIKAKATQYRIERRMIDPSALNEDQNADFPGKTLGKRLEENGLFYQEATKMRAMSDKRIEDALAFQKINLGDHEEFIKAPELYIFDTCVRTIYEFEHLRWDEWVGSRVSEKKDPKEKAIDKDDHTIENIGRILIIEPEFREVPTGSGIADDPEYDPYDKVE